MALLKLFWHYQSCSMAPHLMLEEIGVPYEGQLIDFSKREQKNPEYLAINPHGLVPALIADGQVITQNVAIQYYLATRFSDARLKPLEPIAEAHWLSLISWISNTLQPASGLMSRTENYTDMVQAFDSVKGKGRALTWKYMLEIDARLADRTWLMGAQYTSADCYLLPFIGSGPKFELPMKELKNCTAWVYRMLERPAVRVILERERSTILANYT
jgi:glutathione S-transferase